MDPIQGIVTAGAAAAFFYVLKWVVDGKLHSHSEVEGLRADKVALLVSIEQLTVANAEANKGLAEALPLLKKILELLEEEDT